MEDLTNSRSAGVILSSLVASTGAVVVTTVFEEVATVFEEAAAVFEEVSVVASLSVDSGNASGAVSSFSSKV